MSWTIPETAVPQLGYRIEVLAGDGKRIADFTEMMPHIQMKTLDTQGGRAKRVRLTIIDIFENQVTKEISDEDRQMLSQIVERWGGLSDELKRAVLAVVGSVGEDERL